MIKATEQSAAAIDTNEDVAGWTGCIAALFGLWMLVSPSVLDGTIGAGNPLYGNVIAGVVAWYWRRTRPTRRCRPSYVP